MARYLADNIVLADTVPRVNVLQMSRYNVSYGDKMRRYLGGDLGGNTILNSFAAKRTYDELVTAQSHCTANAHLIQRGDDHIFKEFLYGVLVQCFASESNVRQVSFLTDLFDHILD
jgi:hypothetical protein